MEKKLAAKKIAVKGSARKATRSSKGAALQLFEGLSAGAMQRMISLVGAVRARRLLSEKTAADTVVVSPPRGSLVNSSEIQTISSLNLGNMSQLLGASSKAKVSIVRRLDQSLVIKANGPALRAVRHTSPGLRIFNATYLYPQYLRPLGEDLADLEVQVETGVKVKKFKVMLTSTSGEALAGVKIRALVEWDGAHISVRTDAFGVAEFSVPKVFPRVEMLIVEPDHTHWSRYVEGFDTANAPKIVDVAIQPLIPDAFKLTGYYVSHDPTAGEGVKVGVIDSGVGPHSDLAVAGGGCFVTGEDATDLLDNGIGHGTHVAGIIAGRLTEAGLFGAAPGCTLMSYRVCPKSGNKGRAQSTDVAAALMRAIADGCDLVNISLGSTEAMPEVPEMLQKAREAGIVVFAATGNDGQELLRYPARYSHAQAVAALGRDKTFPDDSPEAGQRSEIVRHKEFVAEFSNYGMGTDFIGPGVAVLSTYPGGRYAMMSGTSMATPFTTGMAARLLSKHPDVLNMDRGPHRADAIIRLVSESTRIPGWADVYGSFGVVKA